MKNFFENGRLSGKSTAAIICFCLAAVAALGIFTYNKSAGELNRELKGIKDSTSETTAVTTTAQTEEATKKANVVAENVPIDGEEAAREADLPQENIKLEQDAFGAKETQTEAALPSAQQVYDEAGFAAVRPVSGEVLVGYSNGELVKSKTLSVWKTHDGVDIAAATGSAVKSAAPGTVLSVCDDPLMGVTVIIDHGSGIEGYYCNLAYDVSVTEGEKVNAGTVIGEVGATADAEISEEAHLHFGLKKNGSWADPADMLSSEGS